MYYLAKHNMQWQHIASGALKGDKLELLPDEKITEYKQVQKQQKHEDKNAINPISPTNTTKPTKQRAERVQKPYSFINTDTDTK